MREPVREVVHDGVASQLFFDCDTMWVVEVLLLLDRHQLLVRQSFGVRDELLVDSLEPTAPVVEALTQQVVETSRVIQVDLLVVECQTPFAFGTRSESVQSFEYFDIQVVDECRFACFAGLFQNDQSHELEMTWCLFVFDDDLDVVDQVTVRHAN